MDLPKRFDIKELSHKRLVWLGIVSVLLCSSIVMSVLTPFPLAIAFLFFGRQKGLATSAIGFVLVALIVFVFYNPIQNADHMPAFTMMLSTYLLSSLVAMAAVETIVRNQEPGQGVVVNGFTVLAIAAGFLLAFKYGYGVEPSLIIEKFISYVKPQMEANFQQLVESGQDIKGSAWIVQLTAKEMTAEFLKVFPEMLFQGVFFWLWATSLMALRSQRLLKVIPSYRYTEKDLLRFKVKDWMIWPLIAALAAIALSLEKPDSSAFIWGMRVVKCLGVFYFFQGFGILMSFMDFAKIGGFIRMFFIVLCVIFLVPIITMAGFFDMWIDFRRFFKTETKKE